MVSGVVEVVVGVICSEGGGGREVQSGSAGATEEGGGVKVGLSDRGGPGRKGVLQGEEEDRGGGERSQTNKRKEMRSDAGGENRLKMMKRTGR